MNERKIDKGGMLSTVKNRKKTKNTRDREKETKEGVKKHDTYTNSISQEGSFNQLLLLL